MGFMWACVKWEDYCNNLSLLKNNQAQHGSGQNKEQLPKNKKTIQQFGTSRYAVVYKQGNSIA